MDYPQTHMEGIDTIIEHRILYRKTLQGMTDYQVHQLYFGLKDEDFIQFIKDRVTGTGMHARCFLLPTTIENKHDDERPRYQFGISSLEDLSALQEEIAMRRAEPRTDNSLGSRLARFVGGYV